MQTLKKYAWKFMQFMQGRNGVDQLYLGSSMCIFLLAILQLFLQSTLLNILVLALIVWSFYRFFSKDIHSRQAENQHFLQFVTWVQRKTKLPIRRLKDIRTHRYRRCAHCETIMRLPRKRGKHQVRCPRCKELSQVRILL